MLINTFMFVEDSRRSVCKHELSAASARTSEVPRTSEVLAEAADNPCLHTMKCLTEPASVLSRFAQTRRQYVVSTKASSSAKVGA
jgi:hypothetical protein